MRIKAPLIAALLLTGLSLGACDMDHPRHAGDHPRGGHHGHGNGGDHGGDSHGGDHDRDR